MKTIQRTHPARGMMIACGIALLGMAGAALADEPQHDSRPPPTKEQREKMAEAHEKMAACLRSDRPIQECHDEMMKQHDMMMHDHAKKGMQPAAQPEQK